LTKHFKHADAGASAKPAESLREQHPASAVSPAAPGASATPQQKGSGQRVFGDTKEAWKSFHASEIASCPHCGGVRFTLDFKHKEKVCSNCGAVLSLRRKQV
jgi:hypothetical protein